MSFQIITDSCANLTKEIVKQYNIEVLPLEYLMNGVSYPITVDCKEADMKDFYNQMRAGTVVKTSMVNGEAVRPIFQRILEAGQDILYIGFSSALSGTFQSVKTMMDNLAGDYPERKCIAMDSLAASMGEGLLVTYAAILQKEGKTIDAVAEWLEANKMRMQHLFTVDDLKYLRRGGRISGATALIGSVLQIKPLMHVDSTGHLVAYGKVRGRKNSIKATLNRMAELIENPKEQMIYIVHGDCPDETAEIVKEIKSRFGPKSVTINFVDQVIGAHSGPGTLAVFFLGKSR
ncbi:MAG: DegV family protein [Clostridia bacterium]|nr:DegV family protein [Clostridia bacterium]